MTLRYLRNGVTATVIGCGVMIGLASAQQRGRDGGLLPPEESGMVTVAGCLMRGDQVRGGDDDKFVLADLRTGPIASVPSASCSANADATAIQLDNPRKGNIDESMIGRWVEISGRLEKETSNDNILRELDVTAARLLPVDAPRQAVAAPPEPEPEAPAIAPESSPEPAPVATSGQADLPRTASPVPLMGLLGLFASAGGLVLRRFRSQQLG